MKRHFVLSFRWVFGAVVVLGVGSLAACTPSPPTPTPSSTSAIVSPSQASSDAPSPTSDTPRATTRSAQASPAGEIWRWALGRNAFDDPNLAPYTRNLNWDETDINVQSKGFKLALDSAGNVVQVSLFNDENALGYPHSESSFRAFEGELPLGLSFSKTAAELGAVLGKESFGGYGTEYVFPYGTDAGYTVTVTFAARHASDLPGSLIHIIDVRR